MLLSAFEAGTMFLLKENKTKRYAGVIFNVLLTMTGLMMEDLLELVAIMMAFIGAIYFWYVMYLFFKQNKVELLKIFKHSIRYSLPLLIVFIVFVVLKGNFFFVYGEKYLVGNTWFNADITRCTDIMSSIFQPSLFLHPYYPIVELVALLPGTLLPGENVVSTLFVSGICTCILQIASYGISLTLVEKILEDRLGKHRAPLFTVLYMIASFTTLWFTFVPETYAFCQLFMILSIYIMFTDNKTYTIIFSIMMCGMNISLLPLTLIIIAVCYKKEIMQLIALFIKRGDRDKLFMIGCFTAVALVTTIVLFICTTDYGKFFALNTTLENIWTFFRYEAPMLLFIPIKYYSNGMLVNQLPYNIMIVLLSALVYILILLYALYSFITLIFQEKNIRNDIRLVTSAVVLMNFALHGVLGFGKYTQVLYLGMYHAAFLIFIIYSLPVKLIDKINKKILLPAILIVGLFGLCNISIYYGIIDDISKVKVSNAYEREYSYVYDGVEYIFNGNGPNPILMSEGKTIKLTEEAVDATCIRSDGLITWVDVEGHINEFDTTKAPQLYIDGKPAGKPFDTSIDFLIYGLGNRDKIIIRKNDKGTYEIYNYSKDTVMYEDVTLVQYGTLFANVIDNIARKQMKLYEDESGLYLEIYGEQTVKTISESPVNIPENLDENTLKNFKDVLINIKDGKPYPNFIAYDTVWYRDAAMMAMVLKSTDNLDLIKDWALTETALYDKNNGYEELDNLGELLYIKSLFKEDEPDGVEDVVKEIEANTKDGHLEGIVDFEARSYYPTAWAIKGLNAMGIEHQLSLPACDAYGEIMWYLFDDNCKRSVNSNERWQYLNVANLHTMDEQYSSGISYEFKAEKPSYSRYEKVLNIESSNWTILHHAWSAAEQYLLNTQK